jgi:hypothetical protein
MLLYNQALDSSGSVLALWKHSNSTTKLLAIDEQSDHNVMQPDRFGETNRFAG